MSGVTLHGVATSDTRCNRLLSWRISRLLAARKRISVVFWGLCPGDALQQV